MNEISFDLDNLIKSLTPLLKEGGKSGTFERAFVVLQRNRHVSTWVEDEAGRFTINDFTDSRIFFPVPHNVIGSHLHSFLLSNSSHECLRRIFNSETASYAQDAVKLFQEGLNRVEVAKIIDVNDYIDSDIGIHWPEGDLDDAINKLQKEMESKGIPMYGDFKTAFLDMAFCQFLEDDIDCLEDEHVQALLENQYISQVTAQQGQVLPFAHRHTLGKKIKTDPYD